MKRQFTKQNKKRRLSDMIWCLLLLLIRPVDTGGGRGGNASPIIRQTCFWRRYKRSLIWQHFWQQFILAIHAPPPFQFSCLRACSYEESAVLILHTHLKERMRLFCNDNQCQYCYAWGCVNTRNEFSVYLKFIKRTAW